MKSIEEVNLKSILPSNGPSIDEVKKYLEKYNDETIIIKCGGSVLLECWVGWKHFTLYH